MSLSITSALSFSNGASQNATTVPSSPLLQVNPTLGLVVEFVIAFLVGGHFLILTTLAFYKPWNIADLLVLSLSMADAINAAIPLQMLNIFNNFIGPHLWTRTSCAVFVTLTYTFRIASVCTITLISGDRAILLTRPLQHHIIVTIGRARKVVIAIWLFSIFMAILPFIGVGHLGYRNGYCFYQLIDFGVTYGYIIESIGIVQLILVLICFIAIKITSSKFVKRQSTMAAFKQTGGKNLHQRETAGTRQVKQMSSMMAIVVLLYYISWLPYLLTNLYGMVTGQIDHSTVILIGFFSLVNAFVNPILYGKMNQRYRMGYSYIFKKILSVCGREKPNASFFDCTRRNVSSVKCSTASTRQSNARKVVDFTDQEGRLPWKKEASNHPSTRETAVRFEANYEKEKQEDLEVRNQNYADHAMAEHRNRCMGNLNPSPLNICLPGDDEKLLTTLDADVSLPDETFDSVL